MTRDDFSVVIAGGGVAALESALTLRELGEDRVRVELLTPEPSFWYRPVAVAEPFGLGEVRHFDLGELAGTVGAGLSLGALAAVDVDRREARTGSGAVLAYDALLVACGAVPQPAVPGALTFRGPADSDRMRALLAEIDRGEVTRVAFVVPWGATWALPAYELALMTAAHLSAVGTYGVELTVVTPEAEPLHLFGASASDAVRGLLDEAGVAFVGGVYPVGLRDGRLLDLAGGAVPAERAVALPRLRGQRIDGLPQTVERFLEVDEHCAVRGAEAVFAAGDITSFPVKQGGIAAQQAVAAAEAIAVLAGASLVPHPFRPVLRGLLLTGGDPQYLRRDLTAAGEEPDWASSSPIWWPPTKIVGRRLAPFLATLTGEVPVSDVPPPAGGVPVDVPIDVGTVDRFAREALGAPADPTAAADGSRSVGMVMGPCPPAVRPGASLDEVVRTMREHDLGSVLVVEDELLVGILTARDVLRAVAGDVSPSVAPVRQWMTASPITATPGTTVESAEALMTEYGIHHLPVVEDGRPVGMVGLRDLARSQRDTRRLPIGLGF